MLQTCVVHGRLPRPVTITDLRVERVEPGGRDLRLDVTFARAGFVHVGAACGLDIGAVG